MGKTGVGKRNRGGGEEGGKGRRQLRNKKERKK